MAPFEQGNSLRGIDNKTVYVEDREFQFVNICPLLSKIQFISKAMKWFGITVFEMSRTI